MRLTCPCCGATLSLEALLNDVAARQAVATALALPAALGPRLLRYLGLFRPAQRSLTWDRAASLLAELQTLIAAGHIQRNGRSWPAPHAVWQAALDAILERNNLTLPLKSHGYLLEIIAGMADRAEARQEDQIEEQRRSPRPESGSGMQAVTALLARVRPAAAGSVAEPPAPPTPLPARPAPPPRTPPPAEFRNLARTLRGLSTAENPDPPKPEPHV